MVNKIFASILSFALLFSLTIPTVYADSPNTDKVVITKHEVINNGVSLTETYEGDIYLDTLTLDEGGNKSNYGYDSTLSVRLNLTITYVRTYNASLNTWYYKLNKTSGSYTILDPQVSITSNTLVSGEHGFALNNTLYYSKSFVNNNVASSFAYYYSFSNYVRLGQIGSNLTVNLKRGTSTWSYILYCMLPEM